MRPNLNLMKATLTGALGGLLSSFLSSQALDARRSRWPRARRRHP